MSSIPSTGPRRAGPRGQRALVHALPGADGLQPRHRAGLARRGVRARRDRRRLAALERRRRVRESHFDHTQADSFRQGGNIPPIWARSRGSDVRLIGLSWAEQYQAIVAAPRQRDRRAGGPAGPPSRLARRVNDQIDFWHATALRGFDSTLRQVGLSLDDVALVDLPVDERYLAARRERSRTAARCSAPTRNRRLQSAEVLALIRGEVDAIYVAGGRGPDLEALARRRRRLRHRRAPTTRR